MRSTEEIREHMRVVKDLLRDVRDPWIRVSLHRTWRELQQELADAQHRLREEQRR